MEQYIGKRILITEYFGRSIKEVNVLEVSPSGKMVKLQYQSGYQGWERLENINIIEVLEPLKTDKSNKS